MGSGYEGAPNELTEDDLLASKINACRGAVPTNSVWMQQTKILDTWKNDVAFVEELKRLKNLKLDIIPECLEILKAPNTTTQADKTETEEDEMEENNNYGM